LLIAAKVLLKRVTARPLCDSQKPAELVSRPERPNDRIIRQTVAIVLGGMVAPDGLAVDEHTPDGRMIGKSTPPDHSPLHQF
jgi:hypothetical protein